MKKKKNNLAPYLMLVFAFIGISIAFYDSFAIYTKMLLWCPPPIDGCNIVAYSPYAYIFNMPLGYFGLVFYVTMFAIAALLVYDPLSRGLRLATLLLASIGVGLSICFMYIQFTFIHAFCIYCLVSFILTLLLLTSALSQFRATRSMASRYMKEHSQSPATT